MLSHENPSTRLWRALKNGRGVFTHEGPGGRKAKHRAPGRACPGKGEEPHHGAAGLSCSHSSLLFQEHFAFAEVLRPSCDLQVIRCSSQEAQQIAKASKQAVSQYLLVPQAGEGCAAPLLAHFPPPCCSTGTACALCWISKLCLCGGNGREGCSALPHFMSGLCLLCPALLARPGTQHNKKCWEQFSNPLLSTPCPLSSYASFYRYLFSTTSTYKQQLSLHFCATQPAVMHPLGQLDEKKLHWLDPQARCGIRVWTVAGSWHEFTEVQHCLCLTGKVLVLWTTHEDGASLGKLLRGVSLASGMAVDGAEKLSFRHRLFLNYSVLLLWTHRFTGRLCRKDIEYLSFTKHLLLEGTQGTDTYPALKCNLLQSRAPPQLRTDWI